MLSTQNRDDKAILRSVFSKKVNSYNWFAIWLVDVVFCLITSEYEYVAVYSYLLLLSTNLKKKIVVWSLNVKRNTTCDPFSQIFNALNLRLL